MKQDTSYDRDGREADAQFACSRLPVWVNLRHRPAELNVRCSPRSSLCGPAIVGRSLDHSVVNRLNTAVESCSNSLYKHIPPFCSATPCAAPECCLFRPSLPEPLLPHSARLQRSSRPCRRPPTSPFVTCP